MKEQEEQLGRHVGGRGEHQVTASAPSDGGRKSRDSRKGRSRETRGVATRAPTHLQFFGTWLTRERPCIQLHLAYHAKVPRECMLLCIYCRPQHLPSLQPLFALLELFRNFPPCEGRLLSDS